MPNFDDDNREQLKRQDPQSVKPGRKEEEDETKPKDRYPREGQGRGSDQPSGEPGSSDAGSSRTGTGSRSGGQEPDDER